MAEPSATRAATRKRSRRSESLGSAKKNRATKAQGTKPPRSQLQQDRLSLGTSRALRDRILQHQDAEGLVPKNLQSTLRDVQKQIVDLQRKIARKATAADVRAHACPTPLCVRQFLTCVYVAIRHSKSWRSCARSGSVPARLWGRRSVRQ